LGAYYSAVRLCVRAFVGPLTGWKVSGVEKVPPQGGLIVAANHISFWDPPLIACACPRELHFLAKEELFATWGLGGLIRGVNAIPIRRGVADLAGLKRAVEVLQRGGALLMFPEGSRMRDGQLHPARPGVGLLAHQADVSIVPCYISGSNRPGQWWRRGAHARIQFGAARGWRELAGDAGQEPGRALYQAISQGAMRDIAAMKEAQSPAVGGADPNGRSQIS
jgi:1-acyl-sn-glycerol-3-phosphate acyltransferase